MDASKTEVREQHHFHACEACGNIWDHDPPGPEVSYRQFVKMHSCSNCGSDRNCDVAAANHAEAAELATHGYITVKGKRYYAEPPSLTDILSGWQL